MLTQMMKTIKFNSGKMYQKSGTEMKITTLNEIDVKNTKKEDLPWLQWFYSGYRVSTENIDWKYWNGCIYVDIDSKHYYDEVRKFNTDTLLHGLYDYLYYNYFTNFYCIQKSNSGTGYHILFYFNVEKNLENFNKCNYWCSEIVKDAFFELGAKDIILYKNVIDKCTSSPYQGMYLTNNELLFGDVEGQWFGKFDVGTVEIESKIVNNPKYINEDNTLNFTIEGNRDKCTTKKYYQHSQRMAIYMTLISVLKDSEIVNQTFSEIVNECFLEGEHNIKFFINEPQKNGWFEKYETYKEHYVRPYLLKEIGYNVIEKFIPEIYSEYTADKTYTIESNQYLGDIDIEFEKYKINHIFAGCGFGKTTWAKKLGQTNRVCVISPLTSINKDAFAEENGWLVLDNNYKDIIKHLFDGNINDALNSKWNICTTWESFSLYELYKYNFDYFIIDEIHTLYMYDYRLNSIRHLKEDFPKAKGTKIVMTGTPSYELNEFDCYKIKINKEQTKTKSEFLFYNESVTGWIYKDIKDWTKNENNIAIIFKDQANYKDVDSMRLEGIDCDIFNSNYKENVEYILNENNIKNNVTIFSVYGQAGINLYIDLEKKVRLYILNKNALGIIQYANRIRNKQVIDKVVIPYKKSKIDNKIMKIESTIDLDEAMRKVDVLNSTIKSFDVFDTKTKSILLLRYGFVKDCLDRVGDKLDLNIQNYKIYTMINNVDDYEKQIQIIYNRLIENDFEVSYNYLYKDVKTNKNTKMRSNQLAGNIVNFDFSQIQYDKFGNIYIKPNDKLLKVSTGNLIEILTNIFNYMKRSGNDVEQMFNDTVKNIIKKKNNITKKDLETLNTLYYLVENWTKFYNSNFIKVMNDKNWDDIKLTATFIRSIYNDKMLKKDWQLLSDEVYFKIHNIRKVFNDYTDTIESLSYDNENLNIPLDDKTREIYTYVYNNHTIGKKNTKSVTINGVTYSSINEATSMLGISRQAVYKQLKKK